MNGKIKRFNNIVLIILVVLLQLTLFSSCQVVTEGKKELNTYCPGLNVKIDGVSWSKEELKKVFVIEYNKDFQKKVNSYFIKAENGFYIEKNEHFADIKADHKHVINIDDNIMAKTIQKGGRTTKVVFNETTSRIIIIEYAYLKK